MGIIHPIDHHAIVISAVLVSHEHPRVQPLFARQQDMRRRHFKCDVGKEWPNFSFVRQRDVPAFFSVVDGESCCSGQINPI